MADEEKRAIVIRALELCTQQRGGPELCEQCPYINAPFPCGNVLLQDALALLREQESVSNGQWVPINRTNPAWWQLGISRYKCSECGSEERIARKHCPECGAKMEE